MVGGASNGSHDGWRGVGLQMGDGWRGVELQMGDVRRGGASNW